jgi:hypothetical protein
MGEMITKIISVIAMLVTTSALDESRYSKPPRTEGSGFRGPEPASPATWSGNFSKAINRDYHPLSSQSTLTDFNFDVRIETRHRMAVQGRIARATIRTHEALVEAVEGEDELRALADKAVAEYLKVQPFYADLAEVIAHIVRESLESRSIKIHSVQSRAKTANSFFNKAATPADENPTEPKYSDPILGSRSIGTCGIVSKSTV